MHRLCLNDMTTNEVVVITSIFLNSEILHNSESNGSSISMEVLFHRSDGVWGRWGKGALIQDLHNFSSVK